MTPTEALFTWCPSCGGSFAHAPGTGCRQPLRHRDRGVYLMTYDTTTRPVIDGKGDDRG